MPKKDQFVSETNIQDEKVYAPLLASIEEALRNEPAAAHAFAALMWLVGDAVKRGRGSVTLITKIVNASISVAYEHTTDHRDDHQVAFERFKSVLAYECGATRRLNRRGQIGLSQVLLQIDLDGPAERTLVLYFQY